MSRLLAVMLCLGLGGCVSAMTPAEIQAMLKEAGRDMPETRDDFFPRVEFDQPLTILTGTGAAVYHFSARPGESITVTARSKGGETGLNILHTANGPSADFSRPSIAFDFSKGEIFYDINGPHSEVAVTLPDDLDGIFLIQVTHPENVASLTLSRGIVPADDIVQLIKPRSDSAGQFMFPLKADGSLAGWVIKSAEVAKGTSIGGSTARMLAGSSTDMSTQGVVAAVGKTVGNMIAIEMIGGWDFIQQSSDQSFDNAIDMARYLHYRHADHPRYAMLIGAVRTIYQLEFDNAMTLAQQGR